MPGEGAGQASELPPWEPPPIEPDVQQQVDDLIRRLGGIRKDSGYDRELAVKSLPGLGWKAIGSDIASR